MQVYRSSILDFDTDGALRYLPDGLLFIENGKVKNLGHFDDLIHQASEQNIIDYRQNIIMPGFIDTHVHYPQVDVIASYGEQLLDWLNQYTFPTEESFKDPSIAEETAHFFINELLRNGTTSALVFASVHKTAVDAFFKVSESYNTRMICGKVMMDRNAPDALCDEAEQSYIESKALIEQWHDKGRQLYAVTPRFAITSTPEQLEYAGKLLKESPDVYLQTHLSENKDEIRFTMELYPDRENYLDVYDHYGLLGKKSIFAHCVHLQESEYKRLAQTQSKISFCPTSNLFLGSGLFDLQQSEQHDVATSVATDVGAGTSFSLFRTLSEAYKICQLNGQKLDARKAFYMATLGNAKALSLDHLIGNFDVGKEADFIVLDLESTPLLTRKYKKSDDLDELLFSLMMLADDRAISRTYIMGECRYTKESE
ncbi:guanine deaminase [Bermanella marisrubri]|uniref:Guanine deaminase n=1 Tax=Bermanella marisrubri TaxID=207949 RepID=Q1N1R0_9GAMM|nr:guanine deaminase [Bermanella marisrubri]EAT12221.1 guanine deaminase [Oceanobacter sp. RED65] [Bermanella marisrubri]QIZ83690.1 guanine deaminase [Bermanella marisrubri]